jgi:hypothetical protein
LVAEVAEDGVAAAVVAVTRNIPVTQQFPFLQEGNRRAPSGGIRRDRGTELRSHTLM